MTSTERPPGEAPASGLLARAIARPVSVVAGVLLIAFFGVLSLADLPIQLTPDVTTPTVTVRTNWPGASPVEVEREILEEQEEVLERVQGLVRMQSTANVNGGEIELEFSVGSDLDQLLVRVANQLSQVPRYPDDADQPVVSTSNASGPPLAVILVRHDQGESIGAYRTWVLEEVVPELERVKGVSGVRAFGGQDSEVHVDFDPEALAARGLSVPELAGRIRDVLRSRSAGDLEIGKRRMLVRTRIAPDAAAELGELVLAVGADGTPVRLSDVARVRPGLRKRSDFAIGDDRDAIALLPSREAGTNVLEVTEALRRVVHDLDARLFVPEGLRMEVVDDQTGYINEALSQVRKNLVIGSVLATLVLLVFLRSIAASAIVAVAIPICVLGTALCMTLLGRSVNVVSLAGITFAVGMVVDNSIVSLENIDTWRHRASDARRAALFGVREVWGALLASTATTAAVFIPIVLWQGEVGELLRDIAYAISISVVLSLIVSVLVIPSLAARLLRPRPAAAPVDATRTGGVVAWAARARRRVRAGVSHLVGSTRYSLAVVFVAIAGASGVALALLPEMEYLPTGNRNLVFGIVLPPPGASVEELRQTGFENQRIMAEHTGRSVGGLPAVHRSFFVGNPARLFVGGVAEDPDRVRELRDFMQALHSRIPGVINFASQAALFSRGIGEGRTVELEITGPDLGEIIGVAKSWFGRLRELVPGARVRPVPVLDDGAPEFHVVPRQARLATVGLTPPDVGLITDAYVDGAILGELGEEGKRKLDVVLRARGDGFEVTDEVGLRGAPVATGDGLVPFGVLADVSTRLGPTAIQRLERRRAVVLQVTPPDSMAFETAVTRIGAEVASQVETGGVPAGIQLSLGGSAGKLVLAQKQFGGILLIALLISYLLLAGLFEDFIAPLAVMSAIPLAAGGGVLALALASSLGASIPLDLMSALGFLILIGVVVNNAILIVDGAIARLREGDPLATAVAEAVERRVRPIFMSTLTSLAGLTPMVVGSGAGSELYRGVGTIVLGGLAVSTVLSMLVVPCIFALCWRLRMALSPNPTGLGVPAE